MYPTEPQEILEGTIRHLESQGRRSVNSNHQCLYRGPNGTKCAVGHWIPDEAYSSDMEGTDVNGLINMEGVDENLKLFLKTNYDLLWELQNFHDSSLPSTWKPSTVRKRASNFIKDHNESYGTELDASFLGT